MKKNRIKILLKLAGIIIGIIIPGTIVAQQTEVNFGDFSRPVPSVSSLATYNNTPVSLSTGMPSISIPLFELPTKTKNMSVPVALAYNSGNVKQLEPASNVGTGWSLLGGGVISREIIGSLNEVQYTNSPPHSKFEFDDIYYYNLPGISGKFRFNRNTSTGTIDIENLSTNKVKISYTRDNSPQVYTFTVASFTVTDENGYKYIFNDYSTSSDLIEGIYQYRSAFFLSQIKLADDTVVANFEYRKDSKTESDSPTASIVYMSCKLAKINSDGLGSVVIDYQYDDTKEKTMNDPYSISQILLKDSRENIISGYKFNYKWEQLFPFTDSDDTEQKGRRLLNKLIKINRNLAEYEKTGFVYNPYQDMGALMNENYHPGLLKKMIYPTGGVAEYNFEAHDYFFNRTSPQYLENLLGTVSIIDPLVQEWGPEAPVINVDTNQSSEYTLTVQGNPGVTQSVALKFIINEYYPPGIWVPDTPDPDDQPAPGTEPGPGGHYHFDLTYTLKKDGVVITRHSADINTFFYQLQPGNYIVSISGTGGKAQMLKSQIRLKNGPYPNRKAGPEYGSRIKSIKHYNSINDTQPVKTEQYSYAPFTDPISSSGYIFRNESEDPTPFSNYVLYKNVSVTDGENGFVHYYFKTPDDYPKTAYTVDGTATSFWQYYTITKSGVMAKKETYNELNELLSSSEYESEFETLQNFPDLKIPAYQGVSEIYTKPAYIKNTKTITKTYSGGIYAKSTAETTYNASNFNPEYIKEVSSDGIVMEKRIRYAMDKNKVQLISANMVSVPLETETKVNDKTIEKIETLYADSGRFDPASVIVNSPDDGSVKIPVKYESYDSYGNLRQYSTNVNEATGIGFPTVIIWGYNQAMPIAKIEGAKLSDIGNLADDIITKSNADKDIQTETDLINVLDLFRTNSALKNFHITTFTYDPLIGTTTETSPDGIRKIYKYDQNGRLQSLTDVNGNILKEYKYNTKPQP
ncbi:hypothetical protein ACM46_08225 [Chryseobacterium angstadtii]|uniref:YD repeat-containing protein n=1 Tax=Chryseobacterium angstadtii TaxID=558151 RepID=A0A0J7IEE4_9FLAO|nr:RHS repeat protein [Chryseobacterium angstadtii]KMQ64271.1 hypothetical protein ACM46_08225 [Chryseobacterium angstadtii]